MTDSLDDLSEVQLRQNHRQCDDDCLGSSGWNSRSASRMRAVRRRGAAFTMPQSLHRQAVFIDGDDQRVTSELNPQYGVDLVQALTDRSTSKDSGRTITNMSDDNDEVYDYSDFTSDEEELYENTVSSLLYHVPFISGCFVFIMHYNNLVSKYW